MESLLFTEYKDDTVRVNYYYDVYQYRLTIRMPGLHFMRRIKYEADAAPAFIKTETWSYGTRSTWEQTMGYNTDLILELTRWVKQHKKTNPDIKICCGHGSLMLYYNDEKYCKSLLNLIQHNTTKDTLYRLEFTRSGRIENYERGVIYLINPKYQYRMFFNFTRLNQEEASYLRQYLREIEDKHLSYGMQSFMTTLRGRQHDMIYHDSHIDVNDDVHATYLNLFKPSMIYRVAKIEKRINSNTAGV